jgi:hypothetical protein
VPRELRDLQIGRNYCPRTQEEPLLFTSAKLPIFEEAICDVGMLEQTAEYLPQKFARATAGQFRVAFRICNHPFAREPEVYLG